MNGSRRAPASRNGALRPRMNLRRTWRPRLPFGAMKMAGVTADQINLIIIATVTPDMPFPSTACLVQHKIGARKAAAFDLEAACSGFIYGIEVAKQFIISHTYETVLVVGAEKISSITDWKDRNTCVLFGDGAGAAILQHRPGTQGLLTAVVGADGEKSDLLFMPGGGQPLSGDPGFRGRAAALSAHGRKGDFQKCGADDVFGGQGGFAPCELDISQIKCLIPHQANRRIVDAVAERIGAAPEQVFVNLHKYGNTSAASAAIALTERAVASGKIQRGDLILLVVFGSGLTWGAAVIEW